MEEFAIGAFSAVSATLVTNPLEVVKTRFQLQGELRAKGEHAIHYRGFFHAMYAIVKADGLLAVQKGLIPSIWHQTFMNGFRLGAFHLAEQYELNLKPNGEVSLPKTALIAAVMGAVTAFTGSPFFLVKVQLQAKSNKAIAVGTQHEATNMLSAFRSIYNKHGISGLWRGVIGSVPRRIVSSSTQLVTFSAMKDILDKNDVYRIPKGYLNAFVSSLIGGIAVTILANPLDTISTRLYNQGVDKSGKGLIYSGYFDCVRKIYRTEGFLGFYKGIVPLYIRTGPQTVLVLVIWDTTKNYYNDLKEK